MRQPRTVLAAIAVAGGAVGLLASQLLSPPPGADHHCPGGSKPAACHYPPDQTTWSIWWTLICLVVATLIGLAITAPARHRLRDRRSDATNMRPASSDT